MKTKIKCLTSVFLTITMLLSIIVVAPITVNASEDDLTYGDFTYEVNNDGSCTITYYEGKSADVSIPSTICGHKVTKIGSGAFLLCDSLTSINIPDGVETIEGEAFKYCEKLANITIPESVSYIGGETFADTKWFNKQADGMVYAGNNAYAYKGAMPQNTTVTLKEGTKSIAGNAFYSEENLAGIILPDSLISVGDYAFYQCENLKSVSIGKNVEKIGESAFEECTSLESITIPEKVTSISSNCFSECSALKNAELPSNLEIISDSAFGHCVSLENIENRQ